jgi:TPR repeat protein
MRSLISEDASRVALGFPWTSARPCGSTQSSAQNHPDAQYCLGYRLKNGIGAAKDLSERIRYYRLAADGGNANAQHNLGVCFRDGTGVAKDAREAVRYYRMAADQGFADAQINLGSCLSSGTGVAKDERQALRYYRLAADQGHALAQHNLGCLLRGSDDRKAVQYFRMAADQGSAMSQYALGLLYNSGQGVERDVSEASRWWLRAAKQGHSDSIRACRFWQLGRKCAYCGMIGLRQDGLKVCAACKTTAYCSPEHQRAHWKTHKPECRSAREAGRSASAATTPTADEDTEDRVTRVLGGLLARLKDEEPRRA